MSSLANGNGNRIGSDANIPLLLQRLAVATLPQQKLEIATALKNLAAASHAQRVEIGRVALPQLVETMCRESSQEVVTEVLELFSKLVEPAPAAAGSRAASSLGSSDGAAVVDQSPFINTEFLLQDPVAVDKLLSLLQEKDKVWLRLNAIRLLGTLANNRPEMLGASVLDTEAGMMRLVDVLRDPREEVRNELLLLLVCLTKHNEQVQNFCAFNDVWGALLDIIDDEGGTGPIVQDCLQVIGNTLQGNLMTCKLFSMDDRCCSEVAKFLRIESLLEEIPAVKDKSPQHVKALLQQSRCLHAIHVFSSLVEGASMPLPEGGTESGSEAAMNYLRTWQAVRSCQDQLGKRNIVQLVAELGFGHETLSLPRSFHAQCIRLLANLVRRHKGNQAAIMRCRVDRTIVPSLLVSCLLHPTSSETGSAVNAVASSTTAGDENKTARERAASGESRVHEAALYLFEALWEANGDLLIRVLGESMISQAHLQAMAEAAGDGAAAEQPGSDNVVRQIVDALTSAGDDLLQVCASADDDEIGASVESSSAIAQAGSSVFAFWTACRLLEHLIRGDETAKELALRVPVTTRVAGHDPDDYSQSRAEINEKFLLGYLLQLLSRLSAAGAGNQVGVDGGLQFAVAQISALRLICEWTSGMPRVVTEIWQSTSNVFLLDLAARRASRLDASLLPARFRGNAAVARVYVELGLHIRGLACLYVGICMQCQCSDSVSESKSPSKHQKARSAKSEAAVVPSTAINLLEFIKGPRLGLDDYFNSLESVLQSNAFAAARHCRRAVAGMPTTPSSGNGSLPSSPRGPGGDDIPAHAAGSDADRRLASAMEAQLTLLGRLYDRRFARFFRTTARSINSTVVAIYTGAQSLGSQSGENSKGGAMGEEAVEALAQQATHLKKLVRGQQEQLKALQEKEELLEVVQQRYNSLRFKVEELVEAGQTNSRSTPQAQESLEALQNVASALGQEDREIAALKDKVRSLEAQVEALTLEAESRASTTAAVLAENEELRTSRDDLLHKMTGGLFGGLDGAGTTQSTADAVRGYGEIVAENRRLTEDRAAVLAKLTATQQQLAELQTTGSAPNANASTPSATSASGADERYSYLLLLLSKLKIENVALRSKLDQQAVSAVTDAVSSELGKLPR